MNTSIIYLVGNLFVAFWRFSYAPSGSSMGGYREASCRLVALNVDDSSLGNPDVEGFVSLVHNGLGGWLKEFSSNIGVYDILEAELLANLHGLLMCWSTRFKKIIFFSDSLHALLLVAIMFQSFTNTLLSFGAFGSLLPLKTCGVSS